MWRNIARIDRVGKGALLPRRAVIGTYWLRDVQPSPLLWRANLSITDQFAPSDPRADQLDRGAAPTSVSAPTCADDFDSELNGDSSK